MAPVLKTSDELQLMREAGRIVASAHEEMRLAIKPGVTTKALDTIALTVLRDHGAEPCFLGYAPGNHPPYPATITASVNQELVHGIPSEARILAKRAISLGWTSPVFIRDLLATLPIRTRSARSRGRRVVLWMRLKRP